MPVTLTAVVLAGLSPALQAAIYKTVDEEGNVVYTDTPPQVSSQALDVNGGNTYTPPSPASPVTSATRAGEPAVDSYTRLSITAPSQDQAVRENSGNLTITVASSPALNTTMGHQVQILLDGRDAAMGGVRLSLTNIDRGTHSLTARIIDADDEVLISSPPITFHMLRYSRLMKKPAARAAN